MRILGEVAAILALTGIASIFYIRGYFKELEKKVEEGYRRKQK